MSSAAVTDHAATTTRQSRGFAARALKGFLFVLGLLIIVLAVLSLVARLGLPMVASYKADIERGLGNYLKRPVSIAELDLRWRGTGPELTATGVVLEQDSERRVVIDEALLDVDILTSLIQRTPIIDELTLVGADIVLERAEDGALRMHGLTSNSPNPAADTSAPSRAARGLDAAAWLFNARRVGMLNTRIRIVDHSADAGSTALVLSPVDLQAESVNGEHRLRASIQLDEADGGRIDFAVDLGSTPSRAFDGHATGRFNIRTESLDLRRSLDVVQAGLGSSSALAHWRSLVDIGSGNLSLDISGVFDDGVLSRADGPLELNDLISREGAPIADSVVAQLAWRQGHTNDWRVRADGLTIESNGERVRADRVDVHTAADALQLEASGTSASLQLAASLAQLIPAVDRIGWIDAAQPRGNIAAWRTEVTVDADGPSVDAVVAVPDLSFDAAKGAPGLSNLSLSLFASDNQGFIEARSLSGEPVALSWPDFYSENLPLDGLDVLMSVALDAGNLRIEGPASFSRGSLDVQAGLAIDLAAGVSPFIDLDGRFALGDASEIAKLMPDRYFRKVTVDWFKSAFLDGSLSDGELSVSGRLRDFPFEEGEGHLRASATASDVAVSWRRTWPTINALNGQVSVDGVGIRADVARGQVNDLRINGGTIAIADVRTPRLVVDAAGRGSIPSLLNFANTGPLQAWLQPALNDVTSAGFADLDLKVRAPLTAAAARGAPLRVDGQLFLRNAPVSFARADLDLEAVTGAIGFDLNGIGVRNLKARWLDKPVSLDAVMQGAGVNRLLRLSMNGALEGADVLSHYGLPLDRFVRGASEWTATLDIPFDADRQARDGFELSARSRLLGSEIQLPAPLYKSSREARELELFTRIRPDSLRSRWVVRQAGYVDAIVDVDDGEMQALSVALGGQRARTGGTPGIRIEGRVDTIELDAWVESIADLINDLALGREEEPDPAEPIPVLSADIDAESAFLRRMPLGSMRIGVNTDDRYLNAVVDNAYLRGNARYPRRHSKGDTDPMKVRLARVEERVVDALLGVAEPEDEEPEQQREGLDPRELPPIEARIASLAWKHLDVQGLQLRTEPDIAGLNITTLGFSHNDLTLIGEGFWRLTDPQGVSFARAGQHETRLSLVMQSSDFGAGFDGIGLEDVISGGAGRARAEIAWPGPAWGPELNTLSGNLALDLERGSISKLEPGAGKLIGLFAFQALPQRLNFDFSDVVNDGLAFSSLTGDATISRGIVDASLVRLEGPIGVIDVTGQTDLAEQAFEQRITVLPRVSAALPVLGAISGGASAGIGVLVAGGLLAALGVDLDRIGLREFRLHGSWDDPTLESWSAR